jgi:hypothetical protein
LYRETAPAAKNRADCRSEPHQRAARGGAP